jgi:Ca-activated chloride channel family protein
MLFLAAVLAGAAFSEPSGALRIAEGNQPPCPLKHTAVQADISGFLARVTVTQQFINPLDHAVEAVYLFPLPNRAAVDEMTMKVGDRTIKGDIRKREEAQRIYDEARNRGQLASLLNQERPNVFTQAVANIGPGMKVEITIRYVETLKYANGGYEFAFPMVVGPRMSPLRAVAPGMTSPYRQPSTPLFRFAPSPPKPTPSTSPGPTRAAPPCVCATRTRSPTAISFSAGPLPATKSRTPSSPIATPAAVSSPSFSSLPPA